MQAVWSRVRESATRNKSLNLDNMHPGPVFILFVVKNLAVLILLLACAAGAGTLAMPRQGLALRSALGLALCAHAAFFLAAIGQLRAPAILVVIVAIAAGVAWRVRAISRQERLFSCPLPTANCLFACAVLLFVLALFPPIAFDETLYHLPFVRAFARDGAIAFLPDLRFPVFPVLHELLCVPAFLVAGDSGTHLVALAEVILIAALLIEWGRRHDVRAGWLAAAMFLGSPLVIQLATVLYVEAALTLFVVAGVYALERERYALAGLFFGSACSVKYLGFYFAAAGLAIVFVRRHRAAIRFALAAAAAALPMTAWILFHTGDPFFPFVRDNPWKLPATPVTVPWRVLWDVTFARDRIGLQPPVTPFLLVLVLLAAAAAVRNTAARWLAAVSAVYLAVFSFLPQDPRYLMPLLPLICLVAAVVVATRWPRTIVIATLLAIAPGIAYAGYRLVRQGVPPATDEQRAAWLARRVPEYAALRHAGAARTYACGAERLKSYAPGDFLGDYSGLSSYARVLDGADTTRAIAERMRRIDARYFLVAKAACAQPRVNGGMDLVYEDAAAQLWRVPAGQAGLPVLHQHHTWTLRPPSACALMLRQVQ
jgi:hypothetical protein